MRRLILVICIFASAFLSMTLSEAAFTTSTTEAPEMFTLLLLGSGLVGLGGYGRRRFKK
jgi:hypothetical protein